MLNRANPSGYGAPFYRIWGPDNKEIIDHVNSFSYTYSEEDDDTLKFTVVTSDITVRDNEAYQENARISFIWGYLPSVDRPEGLVSDVITTYIRDVKATYDTQGLTLNITGTDKASYLKTIDMRGEGLNSKLSINAMLNNFCKNFGLQLTSDQGAFFNKQGKLEINTQVIPESKEAYARWQAYYNEYIVPRIKIEKPKDYLFPAPDFNVLNDDLFPGNNTWRTIKEVLSQTEDGVIPVGRGDNLILTKRNLAKAPVKEYTYRGNTDGELLMFSPMTTRLAKASAIKTRILTWDIFNKQSRVEYKTSDHALKNASDLIKLDPNVFTEDEYNMYKNVNVDNLDPLVKAYIEKTTNTTIEGCIVTVEKEEIPNAPGMYKLFYYIVGNTQSRSTNPELRNRLPTTITRPDGKITPNLEKVAWNDLDGDAMLRMNRTSKYSGSTGEVGRNMVGALLIPFRKSVDTTETEAAIANDIDKAEHESNPATFKAIGDPRLKSEEVLIMKGVGKIDAGRYWIISLTHTITREGYIMEGKLTRNAVGKNGNEGLDKIQITSSTGNVGDKVGVVTEDDIFIDVETTYNHKTKEIPKEQQ